MELLYFFICSLDLLCSGFYRMEGREAREVLWDKLLDNRICGLLFLILARAGAVLHAGLLLIQQAVLQGASIRAVTAAIVLLVKVCAIPFSFFMWQGRKHQKGELFQMCVLMGPFCLSGCQGLVILAGSRVEFSCTVENLQTSLWQVKRPDGTFQPFAHAGVVYTDYRETFRLDYHIELSGNKTVYFQTLILIEATVDDDGQYICEGEGYLISTTDLTVEAIPVLHLEINNTVTSTSIDVVLNQEVAIDCIAEGGKPPVALSWRVNSEEKSDRFIDDPLPSSERVTSTIHLSPTMGDKTLTCIASGQKVTPQTNVSVSLNVQYLPDCILVKTKVTNAYILTCSCKANPEVTKYEIYENGLLFSNEKRATLSSEKSATVFCNATNLVGSFATQPENLTSFHDKVSTQGSENWWVGAAGSVGGFLFLLVVAVTVVIVLICMWKKKKNAAVREANERANTSQQAGIAAAQGWQAATRPPAPEQMPLTSRANQGDSTMGPDSEGEGRVENGTTKHGEIEQIEVTERVTVL